MTSVTELKNNTQVHSNGVANGTNHAHASNGAVHHRVKSKQNGDTHTEFRSTRKKEEIPCEPENTIKVSTHFSIHIHYRYDMALVEFV